MKRIDAMHAYFGRDHVHRCGECRNLTRGRENRIKCARYDIGGSASTDWRGNWQACGKFDVPPGKGGGSVGKAASHERRAARGADRRADELL